jgi:tetratricopeptide (TPR) repeat protein
VAEIHRNPSTRASPFYGLALGFYLLALFSKATACTLPVTLLLVLWLKRKPITRLRWLQLVPFLALSAAMGLLTIWWERHHQGTQGSAFALTFLERLLVASRALWFYLGKLLWPASLMFSYPRWNVQPTDLFAYTWLGACAGLCSAVWVSQRSVGRGIATALVFFVVTLSPLLGFVMLYTFRYSFVADHYQYTASIGPIALAAAGITLGFQRFVRHQPWLKPLFCGALLLTLAGLTWRQCAMYSDAETLWRTTIAANPDSSLAHNNLGLLLFQKRRVDEAIAHYEAALRADPKGAEAYNNLGNALLEKGEIKRAIACYQNAIELAPTYAEPCYNLGRAFLQEGQAAEAILHYEDALKRAPAHPEANYNLANALVQAGRPDEAIVHYEKAISARPGFARAHSNLGNLLFQEGKVAEAIAHYEKALENDHADAGTHYNLANVLFQKGETEQAIRHYELALAIKPDAQTHCNLASALLLMGRTSEAVAHYQEGLQLKPEDASAHYNLGVALLRLGRKEQAVGEFKAAVKLLPDYEAARQQLRAQGASPEE